MKKRSLIALIMFISIANASFANGCGSGTKFSTAVCQKACQNIFTLINLDLSIFSPRASIADVNRVPKTCCCKQATLPEEVKQASVNSEAPKNAIIPTTETIIPVTNKQQIISEPKQERRLPISYNQEKPQKINPKDQTGLFGIELFRHLAFRIF